MINVTKAHSYSLMTNLLRHYIREIILTEAAERRSNTSVYRDIERSQGFFKFNGSRLTLIDPATRPFAGLTPEEMDTIFVGMIEKAGYEVVGTIPPGIAENGRVFSSKYNTYKVVHPTLESKADKPQDVFYITFGIKFSAAESIQFSALHDEISKIVGPDKSEPILVWNGTEYVEVDDADRVGGAGAKADVVLTRNGSPVISISLKNLATGKGSDMQQWGGLSGVAEHPEVKAFISDVTQRLRDGEGKKFWRAIQDPALKEKAVWGPAGGEVDVIVAGTIPTLEPVPGEDNKYRISVGIGRGGVGGVWYRADGRLPDGQLDPVFFSRPEKKKNMGGLKGQRGGIFTLGTVTSSSATRQI